MIAPTLIIGLGGIGSEIVSMVETKAKKFGIDTTSIKFVLIDTDNGALLNRKRNGFSGTTIRISSNITVERCLECNNYAMQEWYPNNSIFNNKTLTDGAGQVRAISRLALEHAVSQGLLTPLYDDIFDLHLMQKNSDCKTMRIAVVSSLAGGTGSGLVLPLALYIADYLKRNYRDSGYNMSGFFMMPDIVLRGNEDNDIEKISLYSNAYATIKELDGFIQKSAGTKEVDANIYLQNRRRIDKKLPIYSFNFLFELSNKSNYDTLSTSQDYKEMIADCIYMPYCSPINELNTAIEDNKFKHLTIMMARDEKNKVYRHFGSIGVATMQYPYSKIKTYLTMRWAQDMLEARWFTYDKEYEAELSANEKLRKKGMTPGKFTTRSKYYKDAIDKDTKQFSTQIRESLMIEKESGEARIAAWAQYMLEVEKRIEESVSKYMTEAAQPYEKAQAMVLRKPEKRRKKNKKDFEIYGNRYRYLYSFVQKLIHYQKKLLISELYEPHTFNDIDGKPYLLEYWFARDKDEKPLSPNGVRYFLQYVYENMLEKEKDLLKEVKVIRDNYDAEIKIIEKQQSISSKELKKKYEDIILFFDKMAKVEVFICCIQNGKERVKQLLSTYERLFMDFREGMEQLEYKQNLVLNEMTLLYGKRVEMVCCQKENLEMLMGKMQGNGELYYGTLNAVYEQIYNMASEISDSDKMIERSERNSWERLLEKWEENFEEAYGKEFNVDVITALKRQVEWTLAKRNRNGSIQDSMIKAEMEECINNCREKWSAPFLSTSIDLRQSLIKENYFSRELLDLRGVEKEIVEKELRDKSGVDDDKIDKYTIFFYQSTFGIHAQNLVPFTKTGDCFNDYNLITRYMHINQNQILTPHIDKQWHRTDRLPELDAVIQKEKVIEEWAVLIYGYVSKKIIRCGNKYNINACRSHEACDSVYQVMEVIREYKEDKEYLLEEMEREFNKNELVSADYKKDAFYEQYVKNDIIRGIYFQYANSLRSEVLKAENCAEMFFYGWTMVLSSFLKKYSENYDAQLCEIMKEHVRNFVASADADRDYAVKMLNDILFKMGIDIITYP